MKNRVSKKAVIITAVVLLLMFASCSSKKMTDEQIAQFDEYVIRDYNLTGVGKWTYLGQSVITLDKQYFYIDQVRHRYYGVEYCADTPYVLTIAHDIGRLFGYGRGDECYVKQALSAPNPILDWEITSIELCQITDISETDKDSCIDIEYKEHYLYNKSAKSIASITNPDEIAAFHNLIKERYSSEETISEEAVESTPAQTETQTASEVPDKDYIVVVHFQESDDLIWYSGARFYNNNTILCITFILQPSDENPCTRSLGIDVRKVRMPNPFPMEAP